MEKLLADKICEYLTKYGRRLTYGSLLYFLSKDNDFMSIIVNQREKFEAMFDHVLVSDRRWSLLLDENRITPIILLEE